MIHPYYIHSAEVPPLSSETIQYRDTSGEDKLISAEEFFLLTNAQYITTSFASKKYIKTCSPSIQKGTALSSSTYKNATDKNLRLVHLQGENAFVGLAVVAARVIRCGEVICRYHGQYVSGEEFGAAYQLGTVDAQKFRGLGAMINHSFPNAMFGYSLDRGFEEWVVIAIDYIAKDALICANYGHNYETLTLGKHAELSYDAACAFVKKSHLSEDGIGELKNEKKWHYLATNPALLLELYFKADWSADKIRQFLADISVCSLELPRSFTPISAWLTTALQTSDASLQKLRELKPKLYQEVADYFRQACRSRSSIGAVFAFMKLPIDTITTDSWSDITAQLDPYITAWDEISTKRIGDKQEFNDDTPLHRAFRTIRTDPHIKGYSLE